MLQSSDGETYFGFTAETMVRWHETIRMEARGECIFKRLEGPAA